MQKSLIPRKFRIGQKVKTKSGVIAKVIGSAIYGVIDGKDTRFAWVEYRLKSEDSFKRTFYRKESELTEIGGINISERIFIKEPFEVNEDTRIKQKVFEDYDKLDALAKKLGYETPQHGNELCGWIATMGDEYHNPISMLKEAMQKLRDAKAKYKDAVMGFCHSVNFSIGYTIYIKVK